MEHHIVVLIVTRPGRFQQSLIALLTTMPQIGTIDADPDLSALKMYAERPPDLVLLDTDLPGDGVQTTLRQIKIQWPQTRCIVLADDVRRQQMARAAGADDVLLKGFPAAQLFTTIGRLLSLLEEKDEWR